ncbi:predicted internal virion protein D [Citrobacter phage CR8]|uniref:Predicted internal virion protein D n=1 Tax=Citrobacter phage CR8 TaxID=1455076 RepID=W6Q7I9_9CAUD|nr:internal virion protein with endolysin domain [Citrobacter phage CR8]CDM21631.1 predicted internal virion protein D [Citrobacter phage CR8]
MATRGIRNNNAGNIRVSKDQWQGATGSDGEFVTFETPEHGIRALSKNLLSYQRQGFDSVGKIISRWAPPNENDTEAYINNVVSATGLQRDQALDLNDPSTLAALARAIMVQENGAANMQYTDDQIQAGVGMALGKEGITPKSNPVSPADWNYLTEGIKAQPKVKLGEGLQGTVGLSVEGEAPAPANKSFGEMYYNQKGETLDQTADKSTFFGFGDASEAELKNSTLGVAVRAAQFEDSLDVVSDVFQPTRWNPHRWSREELDQIRNAGVLPDYYGVITGGSPQNLQSLIELALENQKYDQEKMKAGTGAQLAAGIVGAGVDPLTYVPMAGYARGGKLVNKMFTIGAQSAVYAGAGEALRSSVAGGQDHVSEAMIGGALFGGGMTAIADGLGKAFGSKAVNEFHAPSIRLEARETARNTGISDPSRLPWQEGEEIFEHNGVRYAEVPNEAGSVRLDDGSILIGENPLNPKSQAEMAKVEPEKAAMGLQMGGLTEIGLKLLRSDNPEIRGVAADLVRSPTGMESGATGKIGTTASDVFERLKHQDHRFMNDLDTAVRDVLKDPEFQTNFGRDNKAFRQDVYQRVALAIEDASGDIAKGLTQAERKVYDLLQDHFTAKREMMENPAMFGNGEAKGFFPESRHKGTYIPHVYDSQAKQLYSKMLGAEGLQEAIAKSWLTSYHSRPEVKARVDEMILEANPNMKPDELQDAVQKYANDKAYGISHTDQFDRSSVMEENIEGLVGLENNSFLEARNLFDSDMSITLPNGETFAVNNLRQFDMDKIVPAYSRRVNGDISIMAGTGKSTKEMKDLVETMMNKAGDDGKAKAEVAVLRDTLKILTGRSRRNADAAAFDTVMQSMNDLSFFAKNAYMGVQNLTEIGGMLARGNIRAALHGIPVFRDMAFRTKKMKGAEIKEMHNVIWGKELDDSIRPSKQDVVDRLKKYSDLSDTSANVIGGMKYYTGELAVRSPWTKVLNSTTNYIADTARQGVLSDVVEHALTGSRRKFDGRWLKSAGISKEQWNGIKSLIKEQTYRDADGSMKFKDKKAFSQDPRAMDLWRLGDTVADETILRPHKLSNQDSKAYGALAKTALQFKNFVIKSINGRTMRSFYNASKNHRAIDQALSASMSMMLAGFYYVAQAHVRASAMQDGADREYLKRALDPTMIGYAALSRSSHLGGPLGVANVLGGVAGFKDTQMLRSTILPKSEAEKPGRAVMFGAAKSDPVMGFVGNVLEQIPAFGFAANVGAAVYNTKGYLQADRRVDEREYMTGMYNTFRELVPNDPVTQSLMLGVFEEQGIHIKQK